MEKLLVKEKEIVKSDEKIREKIVLDDHPPYTRFTLTHQFSCLNILRFGTFDYIFLIYLLLSIHSFYYLILLMLSQYPFHIVSYFLIYLFFLKIFKGFFRARPKTSPPPPLRKGSGEGESHL